MTEIHLSLQVDALAPHTIECSGVSFVIHECANGAVFYDTRNYTGPAPEKPVMTREDGAKVFLDRFQKLADKLLEQARLDDARNPLP